MNWSKFILVTSILLISASFIYLVYDVYQKNEEEKRDLMSRQEELESLLNKQSEELLKKEGQTAEMLSEQEKLIKTVAEDVKNQSSTEIQHLKTEVSGLKTQNESRSNELENFKKTLESTSEDTQYETDYDYDEQSWGVMTSVAKVECYSDNTGEIFSIGSGSIWQHNNKVFLLTNEHVISDETEPLSCIVVIPLEWNNVTDDIELAYENNDLLVYPLSETYTYWEQEGLDMAVVEIEEGEQSLSLLLDWGVMGTNPSECNETVPVGEKVIIIGFPYTGAQYLPTITEGLISSFENNGDTRYYVTSAKIEGGNSGGLAVTEDYYCTVGIPTASFVGDMESLGRILLLTEEMLEEYFDSI